MTDETKKNNVVWHKPHIEREHRFRRHGHGAGVIWFTGLSASGKSTIAHNVEEILHHKGVHTYVLDGDNVRHGLNRGLGFTPEDRQENLRRITEVCKLFVDAGIVTLCAFIAPFKSERDYIRTQLEDHGYAEIYVKCDINDCIKRDPKGLYEKAIKGEIRQYTGISSPYEEPENPELVVDTSKLSVEDSIKSVIKYLGDSDFLNLKTYSPGKTLY